jgi:hypothetical protein
MKLKEKFDNIIGQSNPIDWEIECEKIAEEFAIEFAEWICEKAEIPHIVGKMNTTLEIFKQEKGL